jgi:hypothetical protein
MIRIKVINGTEYGTDKCGTCSRAYIRTDQRGRHKICNLHPNTFEPMGDVTSCSMYRDAREPSYEEMVKAAWTLRTEKGGKAIGFAPPEKDKDDRH